MGKQKHILFISSWYPNRYNPSHGIFNRYFAEAVSLFNQVSVLHVCSDGHLLKADEMVQSDENKITTITVYYKKVQSTTPILSQIIKRKRVIHAFERGYKQLLKKRNKPDLIQLNVAMPAGIGAYYLANKYKIPYVMNECWSGYTEEDGTYKGIVLKNITQRIIKSARVIMPTSEYLKKAMLAHNLAGNYIIVPNVINTNVFKPLDNPISSKITQFVHVSSLNEREKNVRGIIRAFGIALKQNKDLKLNIVGESVEKKSLQNLVISMGIEDNVSFKGYLTPEDLACEINRNAALLMFSNYETFSVVIIEAFACGKPVITRNAGAVSGYMVPQLGVMVEKQNETQLAEAILAFSDNSRHFNATQIRQYAVNNYSYEKIGKKLDEIYENVLLNN